LAQVGYFRLLLLLIGVLVVSSGCVDS